MEKIVVLLHQHDTAFSSFSSFGYLIKLMMKEWEHIGFAVEICGTNSTNGNQMKPRKANGRRSARLSRSQSGSAMAINDPQTMERRNGRDCPPKDSLLPQSGE